MLFLRLKDERWKHVLRKSIARRVGQLRRPMSPNKDACSASGLLLKGFAHATVDLFASVGPVSQWCRFNVIVEMAKGCAAIARNPARCSRNAQMF